MNKKGIMDDMFDIMFTVVAFFFIWAFVTVALVGGIKENSELSLENTNEVSSNTALLNYLRTPVGEGLTMLDLILLAENNKELRKKIKQITRQTILDPNTLVFNGVSIYYVGEKEHLTIGYQPKIPAYHAVFEIPGKKDLVRIKLLGREDYAAEKARIDAPGGPG